MKPPHKTLSSKDETLGQYWQRLRRGEARKPLRNLKELAAELGVNPRSLSASMQHDPNGPRGVYSTGGGGAPGNKRPRNTWFDPDVVRAWWKNREKNNA